MQLPLLALGRGSSNGTEVMERSEHTSFCVNKRRHKRLLPLAPFAGSKRSEFASLSDHLFVISDSEHSKVAVAKKGKNIHVKKKQILAMTSIKCRFITIS